jgi:photosystem II stability/assembly factor-like uncharacterized protein
MRLKLFLLLFISALSCKSSLEPSTSSGWFLQSKQQDTITYYAITFSDEHNGWIVGYSGTIKHTSDGGETWIAQQSDVSSNLWDICFLDNKTGWICGANNAILSTTDGGISWHNISPADISDKVYTSLKFVDSKNGWASSNQGEILKTIDGGSTWVVKKNFSMGGGSRLTVFSANTMYFLHGHLYRTFDGGRTWDSLMVTKPRNYATSNIYFTDENYGYITTENGTGGQFITEFPMLMTKDGGMTWQLSDSLKDGGLSCVYFVDESNGWVAGIQNVYRTTDGGHNWILDYSPWGKYLRAKDICFVNSLCGWIINYDGEVYKYQDYSL